MTADIRSALSHGDADRLDDLLEPVDLGGLPVDLLNDLLAVPGHHQHQRVAFALQRIGSPSTVPFVERALAMGFDHLQYTCSDDDVIAKWYSWLLAGIGTPEAIEVIGRYASSENPQIAGAMRYRLERLDGAEG